MPVREVWHAGAAEACRRHGEILEIFGDRSGLPYPCGRMIYEFGQFELDLATVELRAGGKAVSLEPQVFALLALLVENSERLVSKDEIIEKVWDGRIVTDAAVASRVKTARQALGDDGKSQQFIRTIHGQGYRFVAKARAYPQRDCRAGSCNRRQQDGPCSGGHGSSPGPDVPALACRAAVSLRRRR